MNTTRLADNMKTYKKPLITLQDKLTDKEIADKLFDYVEVNNISSVKLNTHVRYFIIKKIKKNYLD